LEVANACLQSCSVSLAVFQRYRIRKESPGSIANLVDPGGHLSSMRISEHKVLGIHAVHRLRERNLHNGIKMCILRAGQRICCYTRSCVVRWYASDRDHPIPHHHGNWRRSLHHWRFSSRLATVAETAQNAWLEHKI